MLRTLRASAVLIVFLTGVQIVASETSTPEAAHQIDSLLHEFWQSHKLQQPKSASDETFLRRVYLDVIGRIPTYSEANDFLSSKDDAKRSALITQLLASDGYALNFYNFWADILRVQTRNNALGGVTAHTYSNYVKQSLRENKPYDQFVRELLDSKGLGWENGAIGYYLRDKGMPLDNMAITSRVFLGTRIECAQCHDHPFDKWTQMQFYKMAAFTYGVDEGDFYGRIGLREVFKGRSKKIEEQFEMDKAASNDGGKAAAEKRKLTRERPDEDVHAVVNVLNQIQGPFLGSTEVRVLERNLKLPHDYQYSDATPLSVVHPASIMGDAAPIPTGANAPTVFANWITSPNNPRFTRVIVNRLWKKVFGAALTEPMDNLTDESKARIPELEKYLEKLLIEQRYDMKKFLTVLLNTGAYQSEAFREEYDPGGTYAFTGPLLRRMSAEQIWDSVVALVQPLPDSPNNAARLDVIQRVNTARMINDAFQAIPPAELYDRAVAASGAFREMSQKLKEMQKQIDAARAKDDAELAGTLSKQVVDYEAVTREAVIEHVLRPILMKLAEKKGVMGSSVIPGANGEKTKISKGNGTIAIRDFVKSTYIPGYEYGIPPAQTAAECETRTKNRLNVVADLSLTTKEKDEFLAFCERVENEWVRAAELDSPALRGHPLRDLGQSDRDFVENGSTDASVAQALLLMNSQIATQVLSRQSQLMLRSKYAPNDEKKLETVYLMLLSRKPTSHEILVWNKASSTGTNSIEQLVFALMNTQQFIFIQ